MGFVRYKMCNVMFKSRTLKILYQINKFTVSFSSGSNDISITLTTPKLAVDAAPLILLLLFEGVAVVNEETKDSPIEETVLEIV